MASKRGSTEGKPSRKNPKKLRKSLGLNKDKKKQQLGDKNGKAKNTSEKIELKINGINNESNGGNQKNESGGGDEKASLASASEQLSFFVNHFESANGVRISSLELESIKDKCIVGLSQELQQDVCNLGKHMKAVFGPSWKEMLCEEQLVDGKIGAGSPTTLIISSSALRSLELLRGVRSLTKECPAVKLFSKHMKVEEQMMILTKISKAAALLRKYIFARQSDPKFSLYFQVAPVPTSDLVSLLKKRVNIGSGTPSRSKKLIDIEALGLSRLSVIVLDMHTDVKGFSLFTLPQVRDEFWDLYKNYFHQRVLQGDLRICLYGPIPTAANCKVNGKKDRSQ